MSAPDFSDFKLRRVAGDTVKLDVAVTRNGSAVSLVGASLWCTGKTATSLADSAAAFQKTIGAGITVTNAAGGLATVVIAAADTVGILTQTDLFVDIQLLESSGDVTTVAAGVLSVYPGVTRVYA